MNVSYEALKRLLTTAQVREALRGVLQEKKLSWTSVAMLPRSLMDDAEAKEGLVRVLLTVCFPFKVETERPREVLRQRTVLPHGKTRRRESHRLGILPRGGAEESLPWREGDAGIVSRFFREMGSVPPLSHPEVMNRFQRLEEVEHCSREEAQEIRSEIVSANLRLLVVVAKKYQNRGLELLDLVQEGSIGLLRAVELFEWRRGYRLSTYASYWIRQAILLAIRQKARTIRQPVHIEEKLGRLRVLSEAFTREKERPPTLEEKLSLAEKVTESPGEARYLKELLGRRIVSLQAPVGDSAELGSFQEDKFLPPLGRAIEEAIEERELSAMLESVLSSLRPREQEVVRLRFGIGADAHTLEEIGRMLHLSRERIRQIELKALKKLKHPMRAKRLQPFWRNE